MFLSEEGYSINPALMIDLVKEYELPSQVAYNHLAYIHSGYLTIISAARQAENGNKNI